MIRCNRINDTENRRMEPLPIVDDRSLIVALTMNPALDITTNADVVRHTDKIRCDGNRYDAGGGGINVARFALKLADGAGNRQDLPAALRSSVLQTLGEEAVRYLPRP